MSPAISIIIPCFNSEKTLDETLKSVFEQKFKNWEAIIVNDGSTDYTEEIALRWVKKDSRFLYFQKENQGLGKTRNFGIEKARGSYILPLDSDNLIEKNFINSAIAVLKNRKDIGVVHGHAEKFGLQNGPWYVDDLDFEKILFKNYIDACAVFRKSLWEAAGGYDEGMPFQGFEDWDLWIKFGTLGVLFFRLDQVTFRYRISKTSMLKSYTPHTYRQNFNYISRKYGDIYGFYFRRHYSRFDHHTHHPFRAFYFYVKAWIKKITKGLDVFNNVNKYS